MTVTDNVIRVQLPGGAAYAPALREAASKTGARSGLPSRHADALEEMVHAAVVVLNGARSAVISLEMTVHDSSISAKLVGKNGKPPAKKHVTELASVASEHAQAFSTRASKTSFTIRFEV